MYVFDQRNCRNTRQSCLDMSLSVLILLQNLFTKMKGQLVYKVYAVFFVFSLVDGHQPLLHAIHHRVI